MDVRLVMLQFTIPVTLPSGRTIRIAELTNKLYLTLIKYSENRDLEGLSNFFLELLSLPTDLDIIDRLYVIVYLRMVFVSDIIIFTNKDNRSLEFNIELILSKIEKIERDNFIKVFTINDITVTLGLPTAIYFKDDTNIINSIIHSIQFKNNFIDFSKLNDTDKDSILMRLPSQVAVKIDNYLHQLKQDLGEIVLIDEIKEFNIEQYSIDILSNRPMLFACSLYSHNLIDYFETLYGYVTKISADPEFYNNLSPVETRVILNIHNKEIERENKELKNQQQ